ncbi:MAG: hypothetical protein QW705_05940 [Zestosphaera sp.]
MTYNAIHEFEVDESAEGGEVLSEGVIERLSLVIDVDNKGNVIDAVVNAPTRVSDPESVAKISLMMTVLARNLLKYLNVGSVEEIDISFENGMLLIVPEGSNVRVALTTAP